MTHGGPAKRNQNKANGDIQYTFPVPPDGGFGWVIVLASFLIHVISKSSILSKFREIQFNIKFRDLFSSFSRMTILHRTFFSSHKWT